DEVHVRVSRLSVHHVGARRSPRPGVAGQILLAHIRLGLHDPAGAQPAGIAPTEQAADQVGRNRERVPREERAGQGREAYLNHVSSACARSAMRSSASSRPIDSRTMPSSTPARKSSCAEYPVWLKRMGSEESVSVPPRLAARATRRRRSQKANARSLVPSVKVTIPPKPLICRLANSWSGCEGSPGYQTRCTARCSESQRATRSAVAQCRSIRSAKVFRPRSRS